MAFQRSYPTLIPDELRPPRPHRVAECTIYVYNPTRQLINRTFIIETSHLQNYISFLNVIQGFLLEVHFGFSYLSCPGLFYGGAKELHVK